MSSLAILAALFLDIVRKKQTHRQIEVKTIPLPRDWLPSMWVYCSICTAPRIQKRWWLQAMYQEMDFGTLIYIAQCGKILGYIKG